MICMLTACSKSVYKGIDNSYKSVEFVEGCRFGIPQSFSDKATAISRITKEGNYDKDTLYYYKNGQDQYFMFCMSSFVIIAQKGTNFDFSSGNFENGVETAPLMGMMIHPVEKTSAAKEKNELAGKIVMPTVAEITLTDTLYNDFYGKFSYMSNGEDNWAIFCGCPVDSYESLSSDRQKVIDNVVYSFQPYEKPEETTYDVIVQGETVSSNFIPISANSIETPFKQPENIGENEIQGITGEPKDSDIYNPLNSFDLGYLYCKTGRTQECVEPVIRIDNVYHNADNIVGNYIKHNPEYQNTSAPIGCHWEAVQYSVDYSGCGEKPYVNIKICGIDGEELKYHGIAYKKRTYDDYSKVIDTGTYFTDAICFYAVPNGCKEYILECGDGNITTPSIKAAYYLIMDN